MKEKLRIVLIILVVIEIVMLGKSLIVPNVEMPSDLQNDFQAVNNNPIQMWFQWQNNIDIARFRLKYNKINFFISIIPIAIFLFYSMIQLILLVKHKKLKRWLKLNTIIVLVLLITNFIINYIIIDASKVVQYITATMYKYDSHYDVIRIINKVIDVFLLIGGIRFVSKNLKSEKTNEKIDKLGYIFGIILLVLVIFHNIGIRMSVIETDWSFGYRTDIRDYNVRVINNEYIGNTKFKVIGTDKEGVTLEYEREYYVLTGKNFNYTPKTETVQQKLIWNVLYEYSPPQYPGLAVDGGTNYYIRFER